MNSSRSKSIESIRKRDRLLKWRETERNEIINALNLVEQDIQLAALLLGVSKSKMYRKLQEYGWFRS